MGGLMGVAAAGVTDHLQQVHAAQAANQAAAASPLEQQNNSRMTDYYHGTLGSPTVESVKPPQPVVTPASALSRIPLDDLLETVPPEALPIAVAPIIPTTEVTTLAANLHQVANSGELWNQLSTLPELSGSQTQEALNFVTRVVQAKDKAGQPLTADQLQQLINYAKSTFDGIHKTMFGGKEFILETYRTAHNAIIAALGDEPQRQAFNLANIPLNTPLEAILKDKALQFFMTNPIPVAP